MQRAKKIVLTGGPCAGKTTVTEVIAKAFGSRVIAIPEAASLLFSEGFPRWPEGQCRQAAQRAIYHVQAELERSYEAHYPSRILILDRGTVDGAVYWPHGANEFFGALKTSLQAELSRYDQVIYLESAGQEAYLEHQRDNPNRTESWDQAYELDRQTLRLWSEHPSLTVIHNECSFHAKMTKVLKLLERDPGLLTHEHGTRPTLRRKGEDPRWHKHFRSSG